MKRANESRSPDLPSGSHDMPASNYGLAHPSPLDQPHAGRLVYLDNLRVLLTILVIAHHVAANYGNLDVWYYNETVSGPVSALTFTFLTAINQAFFMGFFFLLAGYFVPSSFARKGTRAFLRDRLVRLGVPLVVYVLLIHPFVWLLGRDGGWRLGTGPMWFVEVLLLFTLAYLVVKPLLPGVGRMRLDKLSTSVLAVGMGLGSFLIRTRYPVNEWLDFPTIQPAHATQYLCLFALGAWASGTDLTEGLSRELARYWRRAMLVASLAVAAAFVATDVPGDGKTNLEPLIGGWTWPSLVTSIWEQVFAVGLIINLLWRFHVRRNTAGPVLSSAAASTYTVYILHPIVVVSLALVLRDVAIPSLAKFALTAPVAVLLLFASAHYIRRAPVLRRVL
jgi:glucan biosynthesis protein C